MRLQGHNVQINCLGVNDFHVIALSDFIDGFSISDSFCFTLGEKRFRVRQDGTDPKLGFIRITREK